MSKFKTHYNREEYPTSFETLSLQRKVETAGYMTAQQRIENLLLAGKRLIAARAEQFDNRQEENDEDVQLDPTRQKGFDMADAFSMHEALQERIAQKKKEKIDALSHQNEESKPELKPETPPT